MAPFPCGEAASLSGKWELGKLDFVRRVYENSKVTIPKEIRELHGIQEGDFVKFAIVEVIRAPRAPSPADVREE